MNPQRRSELRTMIQQQDNCLYQAAYHAKESEEWAKRAAAYASTIKSLSLSCDHCRSDDAPHLCSQGEWLCDTCLSQVMD